MGSFYLWCRRYRHHIWTQWEFWKIGNEVEWNVKRKLILLVVDCFSCRFCNHFTFTAFMIDAVTEQHRSQKGGLLPHSWKALMFSVLIWCQMVSDNLRTLGMKSKIGNGRFKQMKQIPWKTILVFAYMYRDDYPVAAIRAKLWQAWTAGIFRRSWKEQYQWCHAWVVSEGKYDVSLASGWFYFRRYNANTDGLWSWTCCTNRWAEFIWKMNTILSV